MHPPQSVEEPAEWTEEPGLATVEEICAAAAADRTAAARAVFFAPQNRCKKQPGPSGSGRILIACATIANVVRSLYTVELLFE